MMSAILDTALQQGFLYSLAIFGIVVSFRMMNFPDLTVDGSFALGGAVFARILIANHSPWVAMMIVALAGFAAGSATAFLNRKLGISKILSGILIMLILYSINLRIMGKANISLLRISTLFSPLDEYGPGNPFKIAVFFGIAAIFLFGLCYLATTRLGLFMRATGDNEFMVSTHGINTDWIFIIGIGLANSLVALCGSLVVQNQGFADINMGIGLIIIVLAALIIGETFIATIMSLKRWAFSRRQENEIIHSKFKLLPWETFTEFVAAILGAFLYFFIIAICLRLGLAPTDLKLATGVLVIIGISLRLKGPLVETYVRGKL